MATELDTLIVKLAADTAQMRGELAKATSAMAREMQKQAKEVEKVNASLAKVGNTIKNSIMGALAALAPTQLVRMGHETMKWADDLKAVAERIGVSTTSLQELIGAGRQVNISAQEMTKGMEAFAVKFAEAASGKGRGVDALKALGVAARDSTGQVKSFDRVLDEVADSIKEFDRPSQLAIAKQLFGDEGALKFLDLLGQGKGRLEELRQVARDTGVVISEDMVNAGERFNKTLEKIEDRARTGIRTAFLELAPILDSLASKIDKVTQRADVIRRFGVNSIGPMLLNEMFPNTTDAARQGMRQVFPKSLADMIGIPNATDGAKADRDAFRAADAASMKALPTPSGKKVANFDKTGANQADDFRKLMDELRTATEKARAALDPYRAALADLDLKLLKIKATNEQATEATMEFNKAWNAKVQSSMDQMLADTEHMARLTAAEISGRREVVIALELEEQIRKRLGDKAAAELRPRIEQQARLRAEMERAREMSQALERGFESGMSGMADAAGAFFDVNRNGWQEMGNVALNTIRAIAQEMLLITTIRPLAKAGANWFSSLLGGGGGAADAAGNAIGGGFDFSKIFSFLGFADGGDPPMNRWSLVGERGPELIRPRAPMTVVPNHALGGGGTINLYGAPSDSVRVDQLSAGLRQIGMKVNLMERTERERVLGHVADGSRRGGSFATALGR